ncbi:hypothetical protein BOTCAL_0301g00040 [Botryotinia calthae]|uniref:Uncharacterized protein n=1 Tax=Botryotinia calthae TaxID=38488 RepID=A0A4Y8CUG5_9HELO|nr:hypothetical protein BOTCAL_0301g00040 [Botryotinia calthae]
MKPEDPESLRTIIILFTHPLTGQTAIHVLSAFHCFKVNLKGVNVTIAIDSFNFSASGSDLEKINIKFHLMANFLYNAF